LHEKTERGRLFVDIQDSNLDALPKTRMIV